MKTSYDKYLIRKRRERNDSPFVATANRAVSVIRGNLVNLENNFKKALRRQDAPITAQTEALKEAQMSEAKLISNVYQQNAEADMQRRMAINQQIDQAEMSREMEIAQKKEARKHKYDELIKTGGQVLGGAIGAFATGGSPQGAITGAQIGGGIAGTAVGIENDSPEMISQGIADTTGGALSMVQVGKQKEFIRKTGDFFMGNYKNLDIEQQKGILALYQQALATGDFDSFYELLNNQTNKESI